MAVSTESRADAGIEAVRRALGDRFLIERELGRGGMGAVYLARDQRLDRPVALKVLPAEFASQAALRDRFLRETRTAASFSHPNVVPVYSVEESGALLAYTMGYIEGETLTERVRRAGPLPARELVRLLKDVGYALAYAHGRGVVHRDIKPDNVMFERATGRVLVMDFGISRSMTASTAVAGLTRVGEVVGTPEYMSPEQASGDHVDGRSDLYSLGLTAHFAATGRVAMTAETTQKILVRQLTEQVPPIAGARPDLPPALAAAIDRCVAKDPDGRFATAEALEEAIDAAQLGEREIPLPVRLFAGQLSTLSLIAFGIAVFGALLYRSARQADLSALDMLLPAVLFAAVLFTRMLGTLSEARRLAVAGFGPAEIMDGLRRVVEERAERRAELRADPETRRRRRSTLMAGSAMLAISTALIWWALSLRVPRAGGGYASPIGAVVMVMSGVWLLGTSLVLLINSPFRVPPGERFFRLFWLGAPGRGFVRWGARGARHMRGSTLSRSTSSPSMTAAARASATTGAAIASLPPSTDTRGATTAAGIVTAPREAAAAAGASPGSVAGNGAEGPRDRLAALEARVAELERWRRERA